VDGAPDTRDQPGAPARRGGYPPFQLYEGLHDEALDAALTRYCVTTTGPVVVEVSDPAGPTAGDAALLARMGRRLAAFGRALVVEGPHAVQHATFGGAAAARRRDDRHPIRRRDAAASARSTPATDAGAGPR